MLDLKSWLIGFYIGRQVAWLSQSLDGEPDLNITVSAIIRNDVLVIESEDVSSVSACIDNSALVAKSEGNVSASIENNVFVVV